MMAYTIVSPWTDFLKKCSLFVIVLVNSRYILVSFKRRSKRMKRSDRYSNSNEHFEHMKHEPHYNTSYQQLVGKPQKKKSKRILLKILLTILIIIALFIGIMYFLSTRDNVDELRKLKIKVVLCQLITCQEFC